MKKSRFTLIELITVMVVIIILFGIGAAALVGITTKKGPEGGVRMMTRMIELTRQHAIATNTRIALMMPMDDLSLTTTYTSFTNRMPTTNDVGLFPPASTTPPTPAPAWNASRDKPGIIVRPAVVNSAGTFLRWVEDTEWVVLPSSAYFTSMTGLSDITYVKPTADQRVIKNGTVKGLIFKPNGSLVGTSDTHVFVKPFSANLGGNKFEAGSAHRYMITVNWLTGHISTLVDTHADYPGRY